MTVMSHLSYCPKMGNNCPKNGQEALPKKWATSKKRVLLIGGAYIEAPISNLQSLLPIMKTEMGN